MNLRFCVYPPLRTITLLRPQSNLLVFVHLSLSDASYTKRHEHLEDYTVSLWCNLRDSQWSSLADLDYLETTSCKDGLTYTTFQAEIDVGSVPVGTYAFTFRARSSPDAEWIWAGNGVEDNGKLQVVESLEPPSSVQDVIEFHERVERSPVSGSKVVFVKVPSLQATTYERRLGTLRVPVIRHLFLERKSPYWLEPSTVFNQSDTTNRDVQMALYQLDTSTFLLLLPFSKDGSSTALIHQGSHQLSVRVPANRVMSMAHLVVTIGSDPYDLIADALSAIEHLLYGSNAVGLRNYQPSQPVSSRMASKTPGADRIPECTKTLGWCTWNTFYESVSLDGILSALDSFTGSGIYLGWIMIDDGWQHVTAKRELIDMEADPVKFPGGLKHAVETIRQRHPYIQTIGVWHTLLGYWNGISQTSPLSKEYDISKMTSIDNTLVYIVSDKDVDRFYSDLYNLLSSAGIGMVKVDHQAVFDILNSSEAPNLWQAYQSALAKNVKTYMKGSVIYCMAHSPNVLFNKLKCNPVEMIPCSKSCDGTLQQTVPKPVLRNSDDFFPDQTASHSWHIYSNAVNAYFTANLDWAVLDWDMFQSKHTRSHFHAVARAICGGPVYISDLVGCHDSNLIDRLLADDASYAQAARSILCCDQPTRVAVESLFDDPTKTDMLLKFANVNAVRWAVVAVFNCRDQNDVLGILSLNDIPFPLTRSNDATGNHEYVVYDFEKSVVRRLPSRRVPSKALKDCLPVFLPSQEANIFIFAPVDRPNGTCHSVGVACFGLIEKYNGSQAILKTILKVLEPSEGRTTCSLEYNVRLKHRGRLGIWLELGYVEYMPRGLPKAVKGVEVNGVPLDVSALSYDYDTSILRIDMLGVAAEVSEWTVCVAIQPSEIRGVNHT